MQSVIEDLYSVVNSWQQMAVPIGVAAEKT